MAFILMIPAVVSCFLLAAHFLRYDSLLLVCLSVCSMVLLIPKRRLSAGPAALLILGALLICSTILIRHGVGAMLLNLMALAAFLCIVVLIPDGIRPRLMQAVLVVAAGVWIWILLKIADHRFEAGMPWKRMAAILGGVALWSMLSALMFELPPLRRCYRRTEPKPDPQTPNEDSAPVN